MTITHDANNYVIGRGRAFFAPFVAGTQNPGPFGYFGNTPELSITVTPQTLKHYSSEGGVKETDEEVTLQTDRSLKFMTDNISPENVALYFLGESEVIAVSSGAVSGEVIDGSRVKKGALFQLGFSSTNLIGARDVTSVVIKDVTDATTYVAGTDYEVDLDSGLVKILEGGAIDTGDTLHADYSKTAHSYDRVLSGAVSISGAMIFKSDNPTGKNADFYLPYVRLSPDGDYQLKGDEWQKLGFQGAVLKLGSLAAVYRADAPYIA
jgi:hypothetical protein